MGKRSCLWLESASPHCKEADTKGQEAFVLIFAICNPASKAASTLFKHGYSLSSFWPRLAFSNRRKRTSPTNHIHVAWWTNRSGTGMTYTHLGDAPPSTPRAALGRSERRHLVRMVLPWEKTVQLAPRELLGSRCSYLENPPLAGLDPSPQGSSANPITASELSD